MSFDELYNLLVSEKKGSRCTKVTKQASSYLKSKKYMKCVKNPSGKGYKRVPIRIFFIYDYQQLNHKQQ